MALSRKFKLVLSIIIGIICVIGVYLFLHQEEPTLFHLSKAQLSKIITAAKGGDAEACWILSLYFLDKQAIYWGQKGAELGDPHAQHDWYFFLRSQKTNITDEKAFVFLKNSAEQNNTSSQIELARLYKDGDIVAKDISMAENWLRRASNNGDAFAMIDLAEVLEKKHQDFKTLLEAYRWSTIGLVRVNYKSAIADKARQLQDVVVQKAKSLGLNVDKLKRDGAAQAAIMQKEIPPYIDPLEERNIILQKIREKYGE